MKNIKLTITFLFFAVVLFAQKENNLDNTRFKIKKNYCTAIKNQGHSGTCWSFASLSFIESEVKRIKGIDVDLSEWFVVRNIYPEKIRNYVRTEGNTFLTPGGQIHDVLWVLKNKGIVTENAFQGPRKNGRFDSDELDYLVTGFASTLKWNREGLISKNWENKLNELLDNYLGKIPTKFTYKDKEFSPKSFREYLDINPDDYIQITSFNHHPFYRPFAIESKFNWSYRPSMNLPLDEFIEALDNALSEGYTVALNTDVSEDTFKARDGFAEVEYPSVNQELRQELFENGQTRIDHIMHIVGIATKDNKKYYITKNSWGEIGPFKGFIYISENFIRSKAISLVMNKEALPKKISKKIKID